MTNLDYLWLGYIGLLDKDFDLTEFPEILSHSIISTEELYASSHVNGRIIRRSHESKKPSIFDSRVYRPGVKAITRG